MSDVLRTFAHANASLSGRISPAVVKTTHAYTRYDEAGTALLQREPKTVLDVGAGKQWHFSPSLKGRGMNLIGFDIDDAEMEENALLDQKICGDACKSLGVPDQSVDLIMGRAVIEHLHDTASFLTSANRALREDGHLIVTFASRYAPFAILNRILPQRVSSWLLFHLVPGSSGVLGFDAFYDRAGFCEFKQALTDAGFEIEEEYASYFSASYYSFFLPMFFVGLGFDYVRYLLGKPRLASYFMFIARKRNPAAQ
ncbi:bifunctional 2-polyprenyl-6-hydroxyphenol methylase/3-demethylubiquinol 3-O-methyltransferase UbiG [Mycobacterium sp. URHB0044]|uniref:class I SAM-dependent methyltransferase n=1 Tax=Mycobacterium sp. URHB0044 TaxID=1380386 RepID=UPI0012DEA19A|nr:class I SAM-dependent methyltransferase [Mycobacterium sp. URHB0044]